MIDDDKNRSIFIDHDTRTSLSGKIKPNFVQYTKHYPQWPLCLGMLFLISCLFVIMKSWHYLPLPIISAYILNSYWQYIKAFCYHGNLCAAQVISVNPLRIAVFTDLSMYGDPYPVIKVIKPPVTKNFNHLFNEGSRLPIIALYQKGEEEDWHWKDFNPKLVQYVTSDRIQIINAERRISRELWDDLELGLKCLSAKIEGSGLYPLIREERFMHRPGSENISGKTSLNDTEIPVFVIEKSRKKSLPEKIWSVIVITSEILSILLLLKTYVLTPVYFRLTHTINPVPSLQKVNSDTGGLPASIENRFDLVEKKFRELRFEKADCIADFSNDSFAIYVMIFINDTGRILGTVYATHFPYHSKKKLETVRMEFLSLLPGGALVTTTDNSDAEYFGKLDDFINYIIIGRDTPEELFEIHQTLMTVNHHDISVPLSTNLDHILENLYVKKLKEHEKKGVLFFDDDKNVYRPTLKGAFSMVWQKLFPGNYFRRKKIEERYSEILKDIDLHHNSLK